MPRLLPTLLLSLTTAVSVLAAVHHEQVVLSGGNNVQAPIVSALNAQVIDDRYIVVLKPGARAAHHQNSLNALGHSLANFETFDFPNFEGYVGSFPPDTLNALRNLPDVEYIERDQVVTTSHPTKHTKKNDETNVQHGAEWGLSRISHKGHLTDKQFDSYHYYENDGEGVTAYVVDTGVNIHHEEFEGRAVWGATIPANDQDVDGNGHGTHCAGTIGGKTYGVSKKVKIVAVKVLRTNGSGTMSDVVRGVEWVIKAHRNETQSATDGKRVRSVGNMSLGGGMSRVLNRAVDAAFDSGVTFAVAAGNDNRDACDYSPASASKPVTVGATTRSDARAWFSNWGKCTDIFAPGHQIKSAWIGSNTATNVISGTSMATPHVVGILAAFLSREKYQDYSPKQLKHLILKAGLKDLVSDMPDDTKNLLAYTKPPHKKH
ncbi:serine protease [Phlyctochytrium arcticum]|nr:serine protease [Phlyctochytrium arcticum]